MGITTDPAITEALGIINKLLALPAGEQMYAKEIKTLFRFIELGQYPPIMVRKGE